MLGGEADLFLIAALEREQGDAAEGRVVQLAPELQFLVVETHEIMAPGALDRRVERGEGLHINLPFHIPSPRAAGDLRQQLKGPLRGAEIGQVQREVGVDDAHEGHVGEVQPLGDHLGAHEDVDFADAEIAEDAPEIVLAFQRVGVHAAHPRFGEQFDERVLDPFGADAGETDFGVGTGRHGAHAGHPGLVAADVAGEFLFPPVVGEGHTAIRALGDVAAERALQGGAVPPAVEEEDGLFLPFQPLLDRLLELGRKDRNPLAAAGGVAHVHDAHMRHFLVIHPLGHFEQFVFAALAIMEALQGGRGRAEHDGGALQPAADHGHIAGVVPGRLFLFVSVLVLLVHDHQSQRLHGRENGRARADDDPGAALADFVPFVMPFPGRQMTVQHRHQGRVRPGAEPGFEALHGLRREGDFGHEHDAALALRQGVRQGLQINLRLAAPRDAVQQEHPVADAAALAGLPGRGRGAGDRPHHGGVERGGDARERGDLLRVHHQRLGGEDLLARVRVAFGDFRGDDHQALVLQLPHRGGGGARERQQLLQRQFAALLDQVPNLALAFGQFGELARRHQGAHMEEFAPAGGFFPHRLGQHALERGLGRAAVVVADPARQLQHLGRDEGLFADDFEERLRIRVLRGFGQRRDTAQHLARSERHLHAGAHFDPARQLRGNEVIKLPAQRDFQRDPCDHGGGGGPEGFNGRALRRPRRAIRWIPSSARKRHAPRAPRRAPAGCG